MITGSEFRARHPDISVTAPLLKAVYLCVCVWLDYFCTSARASATHSWKYTMLLLKWSSRNQSP